MNESENENEEKEEKKEEELSEKLKIFSKIKKVDSEIDISIEEDENKEKNFNKNSGEDLIQIKDNNNEENNENNNKIQSNKNIIEISDINDNLIQNDDEMQLPDFYEIDFYDFELKKITESEINSINKIKEKYNIKKITSFKEIEDFLHSNEIKLLDSNNFSIEKKPLYQHRDVIFLGNIFVNNNEKMCFIKCFNFNNETELNEIMKELHIFFTVSQNSNFCNEMFGYYFDDVNKCLYIFYEYFKLKIINVVINYDLKENSERISNDEISLEKETINEKYLILNQLTNFLSFIHSRGIIHRDLSLEYFYFDEERRTIKIFDFTNSFIFPEEMLKSDGSEIDSEILKELKSLLYKDGLFLTPKFIPPELSSEAPKVGYYQDIWAFGCMLIELFLDYSKYEDEAINPLLTRVFQGDQFNNKTTDEEGDLIIKDAIPKIPKTIPKEIGKIILKCIEKEIYNRITTDKLIDKINVFLKEEKFAPVELSTGMRTKINKMIAINNKLYNFYKDEGVNEADFFYKTKKVFFKNCEEHPEKIKNLYCRNCKEVICDIDYKKEHEGHKVSCLGGINPLDGEKTIEFIDDKKKLRDRQIEIEKIELDRNYKVIEKFCNTFNNDYENEKEKIKKNSAKKSKNFTNCK
jgi:serine/threonine protein kinase